MADALPKPIKRRSFTPRQRAMVAEAQAYGCANCGCSLTVNAFQIDHIQRLDALGKHEPSNWQALCVPCHAEKTRDDNREAKKGARIRGEKGQRARREKHGSRLKSNPKIQSRGFQPPLLKTQRSEDPGGVTSSGWAKGRKFGRSSRSLPVKT